MKNINEKGFSQYFHTSYIKRLPKSIVVTIENSQFIFFADHIDWVKLQCENPEMKQGVATKNDDTFAGKIPAKWKADLPQDITFTIKQGDAVTVWEVSLKGFNYDTFVAKDIVIQRKDEKLYSIIMAGKSTEPVVDYSVRISTGHGYACPIIFPTLGSLPHQITGRRPVVKEVAGIGGYVGAVVLGTVFHEGQWMITSQGESKVDQLDQPVKTQRSTRYSIQNPDQPDPPEHGIVKSGFNVGLDPRFICAGDKLHGGGLAKVMFHEYDSNSFVVPDNQRQVSISEFLSFGDGPGTIATCQWIVSTFGSILSKLTPNPNPASYGLSPDSNGSPISIGIIRNGTWSILARSGEMFDKDGNAFPCLRSEGFDPSRLDATPVVHHLGSIDTNTKRVASTSTVVGLSPVVVYEYQAESVSDLDGYIAEPLDDFIQDGDGLAQSALGQYLWHLFGSQLATINPKGNCLPAITN